jgi:hypothetical protein
MYQLTEIHLRKRENLLKNAGLWASVKWFTFRNPESRISDLSAQRPNRISLSGSIRHHITVAEQGDDIALGITA